MSLKAGVTSNSSSPGVDPLALGVSLALLFLGDTLTETSSSSSSSSVLCSPSPCGRDGTPGWFSEWPCNQATGTPPSPWVSDGNDELCRGPAEAGSLAGRYGSLRREAGEDLPPPTSPDMTGSCALAVSSRELSSPPSGTLLNSVLLPLETGSLGLPLGNRYSGGSPSPWGIPSLKGAERELARNFEMEPSKGEWKGGNPT